jgi:hypothetical protein
MSITFHHLFRSLREFFHGERIRHHAGLITFITLPVSIGLWIFYDKVCRNVSLEKKKEVVEAPPLAGDTEVKNVAPASPTGTIDMDLSEGILSRPSTLLINFSRQQLPTGNFPIPILVSSVKDCTRMCVQLSDTHCRQSLLTLVSELTAFYQNEEEGAGKHPPTHLNVGDFVAAFFVEDKTWQRAEVREVDLHYFQTISGEPGLINVDQSTAEVDYYDYGDSSRLPLRFLRLLSDAGDNVMEHFLRLPFQAIPVQLSGIRSKCRDGSWSEESIEYFEKISSTELVAYSLDACVDDGGTLADIYDPNAMPPQEKSLAGELVRMGYAEWISQ